MASPGVLLAVDQHTADFLTQLPSQEERANYLPKILEKAHVAGQPQWVAALGNSWDALHRSLTDGQLAWHNGEYPLNHVVFGGEVLCATTDYIGVLKTARQVADIAQAVSRVFRKGLREQYFLLDPEEYGKAVTELDFSDAWQHFEASKEFWQRAAAENRSVLFIVGQ